jgi:DNA-binding NarL/FixJ family response regulator
MDGAGSTSIRVLVVDDHEMFTSSVASVLAAEQGIDVVATASNLASARSALRSREIDVMLLDQHLPDGTGVGAITELKALSPTTKVVVLTGSADDETLVAAIEAGCSGFLEKSRSVQELVAAVRAAAAGEVLVSPALLSRLIGRLHRDDRGIGSDLTARELDVLGLLAEGLSNAAIAGRLFLSVNTVRNHVANVLAKLGVHSKLEALSVAVREGLLPRDGGR